MNCFGSLAASKSCRPMAKGISRSAVPWLGKSGPWYLTILASDLNWVCINARTGSRGNVAWPTSGMEVKVLSRTRMRSGLDQEYVF